MAIEKRQSTKYSIHDARGQLQIPLRILVPLMLKVLQTDLEYHYIKNGEADKIVIDYFQCMHYNTTNREQCLAKYNIYSYFMDVAKDYGIVEEE